MAIWLVLMDYVDGERALAAGDVIDDTQQPVTTLQASGLVAAPYDAAMDPWISAYLAARGSGGGQPGQLMGLLEVAGLLASSEIADGSVTTLKLDDEAVTTAKIDDDAITAAKIAAGVLSLEFVVANKAFADSPYALAATDEVVRVTTTGGVVRIDLPVAPGTTRRVIVRKITIDANKITLRPQPTHTINGGVAGADFDLPDSEIGGVPMQWAIDYVGGVAWDAL